MGSVKGYGSLGVSRLPTLPQAFSQLCRSQTTLKQLGQGLVSLTKHLPQQQQHWMYCVTRMHEALQVPTNIETAGTRASLVDQTPPSTTAALDVLRHPHVRGFAGTNQH